MSTVMKRLEQRCREGKQQLDQFYKQKKHITTKFEDSTYRLARTPKATKYFSSWE